MRYDTPERREQLAADYVLGTLRGGARRRFERLMREDASLAAEVASWQRRLGPLAEAIPPLEPPARVWHAVEQAIGAQPGGTHRPARPGFWTSLAFWRGFGLAAAAAAVVLAIYIGVRPPAGAGAVAVLSDEAGHAAILLEARPGDKLALHVLAARAPGAGHDLELWMLPKGETRMLPLGVLPSAGSTVIKMSAADAASLPTAAALAVSIEPAGGSPTGLPTGPVLYKGTPFAAR